ncbi:thioredoxin family protein [bacterium]|nr:thioredoxin family protein [bacterium]
MTATLGCFSPCPCSAAEAVSRFSLPTTDGRTWSSDDVADARFLVVAFIGTECPLMQLYAPRLESLAKKYQTQGVRFVAINSNLQDKAEEVASFVSKFGLTFPVLMDDGARIADSFDAKRTPEVFVLDATRKVRYRGPIDDQGRVGFVRLEPKENYLADAIDQLLAGKDVRQPVLPATGCLIGRKHEPSTDTNVTYAKDVSRIFQKRCVECHRDGEIGPFAMDKYDDLVGWADMIREVVDQERMPPWFANPAHGKFVNDARLTEAEKSTILAWVDAGAPMGDPKDLPEPRQFVPGWNIGEPHEIIAMAEKPYDVPLEGAVPYEHFVVDPGWTEDKWITDCEVRPGARSVVHHVFVLSVPPDAMAGERNGLQTAVVAANAFKGGLIAGYAPGTPPFTARPKMARRVTAGSKIVFQIHYTPNGRSEKDLTRVGFKFCDKSAVEQEMEGLGAQNFLFWIPANTPDHVIKASYQFKDDRVLRYMMPHMHLRGKSFQFIARFPDGRRELLLDVPRFDFNWQIQYELAEPILMPKGAVLECVGHYDNSSGNPANPNPNVIVRPGQQTWEEMMIGWFSVETLPKNQSSTDSKDQPSGKSVGDLR